MENYEIQGIYNRIELLDDEKHLMLDSIQCSIQTWNQTKFYLMTNGYIFRFWKNKQHKRDIEECNKEIDKLEQEYDIIQIRFNKQIKELYSQIEYSWQVPIPKLAK